MIGDLELINQDLMEVARRRLGDPPYWLVCHCVQDVEHDPYSGSRPTRLVELFRINEKEQAEALAHQELAEAFPDIDNCAMIYDDDGGFVLSDDTVVPPTPLVGMLMITIDYFKFGFTSSGVPESDMIC